jgi:hypothetical protein
MFSVYWMLEVYYLFTYITMIIQESVMNVFLLCFGFVFVFGIYIYIYIYIYYLLFWILDLKPTFKLALKWQKSAQTG